ncbi:MAG: penicillin-binding protein activator [Pseudomonadota bacterium]|nr:penicillin-binding protein activator [Pseudomonadota bacterium]
MGKKYFFVALTVVLLVLTGCAELQKSYSVRPAPDGASQRPLGLGVAEPDSFWQKQAEQLERLGDYSGACRIVRERYLRSPDMEVGDRFSLLLSYLTDEQVADWWSQESDAGLLCRVTAEYFLRLRRQPAAGLSEATEQLLLELARKLSSECDVSEDFRTEAQDFLLFHQTLAGTEEFTIGCLLPLSGSNAAAGERLLRGMELALDVYPEVPVAAASEGETKPQPQPLPRLRLLIYDTAGEGERARAGVRYLVNEKEVDLLVGPYTGKAANYAAVEAQSLGVTMISLSPLLRNLERYDNVFLHYPTIRNQAVSLAGLAMTRMGLKDFAMLVPKNRYGREFAENFTAQVTAWGGQVVRQVYYDSSRPDFGPAIREMIGSEHYRRFKEKRQEYEAWSKERQRQMEKAEKGVVEDDSLAELAREIGLEGDDLELFDGEEELMSRPLLNCDFEAIVVPDRAQTLKLLIPQLAFYDLEECWLLGGRYWNSKELLASASEYADGALFVDAFCANCADASPKLIDFQEGFSALYPGEESGLLETYGFDTIMLLRQLLTDIGPEPDAETWRQALADCRNLPLASGLTTTLGDGEIAKQLYPLTFRKGRIKMVDESCY